MKDDSDAILDDLLIRWHQWSPRIYVSRGFNRETTGMEGYITSRQYDDQNGALDDEVEHLTMRTVGEQIAQMVVMQQICLTVMARALTLGVVVFSHPRLPKDEAEFDALKFASRSEIAKRLRYRGVL